jgi:stress-induced morphogen
VSTRRERIETTLSGTFHPTVLVVENESHMHSVKPGAETHFKVLVVSEAFEGLPTLARHRRVHEALSDELAKGLHALSLRAKTPVEAAASATPFESPECLGGSKAKRASEAEKA